MGRDTDRWTPVVERVCPVHRSIQYEEKDKKKLVTMKLDSSDRSWGSAFFEMHENEHVGIISPQLNLKKLNLQQKYIQEYV